MDMTKTIEAQRKNGIFVIPVRRPVPPEAGLEASPAPGVCPSPDNVGFPLIVWPDNENSEQTGAQRAKSATIAGVLEIALF